MVRYLLRDYELQINTARSGPDSLRDQDQIHREIRTRFILLNDIMTLLHYQLFGQAVQSLIFLENLLIFDSLKTIANVYLAE